VNVVNGFETRYLRGLCTRGVAFCVVEFSDEVSSCSFALFPLFQEFYVARDLFGRGEMSQFEDENDGIVR
jgi:hypothetical protein